MLQPQHGVGEHVLEVTSARGWFAVEQFEQLGAIGGAKPVVHQPHQQRAQGIELVRPTAHGLAPPWRFLWMHSSNSLRTRYRLVATAPGEAPNSRAICLIDQPDS